jgi:hypothetical protein
VTLKLVLQQLLEALDMAHATGIGEWCFSVWLVSGGVRSCLVWRDMWLAELL